MNALIILRLMGTNKRSLQRIGYWGEALIILGPYQGPHQGRIAGRFACFKHILSKAIAQKPA